MSGFISKASQKVKLGKNIAVLKSRKTISWSNRKHSSTSTTRTSEHFKLHLPIFTPSSNLSHYNQRTSKMQLIECTSTRRRPLRLNYLPSSVIYTKHSSNKQSAIYDQKKSDPMNKIGSHLTGWFQTILDLQPLLAQYHEDRLVFDHYKNKMDQIRYERQIMVQKGTLEQPKFTQTFQRVIKMIVYFPKNEEKYEKALQTYQSILKSSQDKMSNVIDNRFNMINNTLESYLISMFEFSQESYEAVKNYKDLMKKFPLGEPKKVARPSLKLIAFKRIETQTIQNDELIQSNPLKQVSEHEVQIQQLALEVPNKINPFLESDAFAQYDFNQLSSLSQDQKQHDQQEEKEKHLKQFMSKQSKSQIISQQEEKKQEMFKSLQERKTITNPFLQAGTPFDEKSTPFDESPYYYETPPKTSQRSNLIKSPDMSYKQQSNPFLDL